MADRYFRIDVLFFHKRTFDRLHDHFGYAGPLVFLAYLAQVKTSPTPGTFTYASEPAAWAKLGFEGRQPDFTLDEFFRFTGRMKQTSRTSVGRLTNVVCTHYERWQKDSRRYEEAARKSRKRAQTSADTKRTPQRTRSGRSAAPSSITRSTPKPPSGTNNGKTYKCPRCPITKTTQRAVTEHLETVHGILPTETAAA